MNKNNGDDMFDRGTPWDYIQDMARLLDSVVASHNKLAEEHRILKQKHVHLESALQHLRRDLRNGEYNK